jgi:DNA adenine methylase
MLLERIPYGFSRYIEPFAGSACLFFALDPKIAILSDRNPDLIDAYKTITGHPIRVLRLAKSFASDSSEYYRIRSQEPWLLSPLKRAARFLYLNRHCFNALYRTKALLNF